MTTFEVASDAPHLFPLSPYKAAGLHQAMSFLHKNVCNVRDVEFARAYRITNTTIEPVSFSVPRVKTAFFQAREVKYPKYYHKTNFHPNQQIAVFY